MRLYLKNDTSDWAEIFRSYISQWVLFTIKVLFGKYWALSIFWVTQFMKKVTFFVNLVIHNFWLELHQGLKFLLWIDSLEMYRTQNNSALYPSPFSQKTPLKNEILTKMWLFRDRFLPKYGLPGEAGIVKSKVLSLGYSPIKKLAWDLNKRPAPDVIFMGYFIDYYHFRYFLRRIQGYHQSTWIAAIEGLATGGRFCKKIRWTLNFRHVFSWDHKISILGLEWQIHEFLPFCGIEVFL